MPDAILFWNAVALEADALTHTRPPMEQSGPILSARALAIVHLAMYDAYSAIDPSARHPTGGGPYLPGLPMPPAGASAAAAAGGAAYAALSALYPSQQARFDVALGQGGNALNPGHTFGVDVASALLRERRRDPDASGAGYVPSVKRGRHRVDPDNPMQGFYGPFYGARSPGFAITVRHDLDPPPFYDDSTTRQAYLAALREVRGLGIAPELTGTLPTSVSSQPIRRRSVDQTLIGIFWAYDGAIGLGTPVRLYNQILRRIAMARSPGSATTPNTEPENARLFALVNAAMGDAGILAWDQKYLHDFWRPVVGIREHDISMGPAATEPENDISNNTDTGWLPLGAPATNSRNPAFQTPAPSYACNASMDGMMKNFTPPFPAYPSGHATFGGAGFHIARLFYGIAVGNRNPDPLFNNLGFVSDELNGLSQDNRGTVRPRHLREFSGGLWQMIIENAMSRIFLGVHWLFDAFAADVNRNPIFGGANDRVGGVPLGLRIAEDIFSNGLTRSPVQPRYFGEFASRNGAG